jgi:TRAP-type C4-dicarboxylate transport system permease small subunit
LPRWLQTALNWLSAVSLAAFAGLLAYLAWFVVRDTQAYQSVSQTPWATPLVYPQSAWLVGLILFALVSAGYALRATWLLARGDVATLNQEFGPRTTKDEVDEELEDLKARSDDDTVSPTTAPAGAQA